MPLVAPTVVKAPSFSEIQSRPFRAMFAAPRPPLITSESVKFFTKSVKLFFNWLVRPSQLLADFAHLYLARLAKSC